MPWIDTRARFAASVASGGRLLDLGTSDGSTLTHIAELRPDLLLFGADIGPKPLSLSDSRFVRIDLNHQAIPWPNGFFHAITCMHLLEHLATVDNVTNQIARLLPPRGLVYIEVPGPASLNLGSSVASRSIPFTVNFHDDPSHQRFVPISEIQQALQQRGLQITSTGTSRNWLFGAMWPLLYRWARPSRRKYIALIHFTGWSAYVIARKT